MPHQTLEIEDDHLVLADNTRVMRVVAIDYLTGSPLVGTSSNAGAIGGTSSDPRLDSLAQIELKLEAIKNKLTETFPSGISNFNLIPQAPLTATARPLTASQTFARSIQIQSIRPDGSDNLGLIAIGTSAVQTFYMNPGSVWSDSAPLGQTLDLSQIYIRSLVAGDCITLITRG